jgi:hypothetical protein
VKLAGLVALGNLFALAVDKACFVPREEIAARAKHNVVRVLEAHRDSSLGQAVALDKVAVVEQLFELVRDVPCEVGRAHHDCRDAAQVKLARNGGGLDHAYDHGRHHPQPAQLVGLDRAEHVEQVEAREHNQAVASEDAEVAAGDEGVAVAERQRAQAHLGLLGLVVELEAERLKDVGDDVAVGNFDVFWQARSAARGAEERRLRRTLGLGKLQLGQRPGLLALLDQLVQCLDIGQGNALACLFGNLHQVHALFGHADGDGSLDGGGVEGGAREQRFALDGAELPLQLGSRVGRADGAGDAVEAVGGPGCGQGVDLDAHTS